MVHSLIGLFCGVFGNGPDYIQLTHGIFDEASQAQFDGRDQADQAIALLRAEFPKAFGEARVRAYSVRVMGPCAAMGAGAAHALDLAARAKTSVHDVDPHQLHGRLAANLELDTQP